MLEVIRKAFSELLIGYYSSISNALPTWASLGLSVFIFALGLALVSAFIWKFYRVTSKRDLISLNLSQYNQADNPGASKFLAVILYIVEYILIMPALILLWFFALAVVLLLISGDVSVDRVLFLTIVVVLAVRMLAYYHSEIAKDLAKLFPFIALSFFLLNPHELSVLSVLEKISSVSLGFYEFFSFFVVVFIVEVVLRGIHLIRELSGFSEEEV